MVELSMKYINDYDPEIARVLELELRRQRTHIELIASENMVSPEVMAVMGSVLTNKYAEGYPGHRYYGGCEYVDLAENICIERAKMIFDAKYANVQAHSGSQANFAVYLALCKPGDTVMGMDLNMGGHLTHGSRANFSGKTYNIVPYGVNPETGCIDYDQVRAIAKECKPRMIITGASAYPRAIDFKAFGDIAKEVGAYLMVDIAHIAGLVAAGEHQSPLPHADVVTMTTHKTMRGPRGGIILTNDADIAKKIDSAMFPGTQGKSCDTFGPTGPWLVTRDEVKDPQDLKMWLTVNGETMQNGSTRTMVYGVAFLVSYLSQFMSLHPGDIISTGTPPGVGMGMKPPRYLKDGDVVELGIEGLGTQRQTFRADANP